MRKITLLLLLFVLGLGASFAQDDPDITDKDLKNYAIMEMAVESITSQISPMVSQMIEEQNEKIQNPDDRITSERWSQLEGTGGDAGKLQAVNAKDWEIAFLKVVNKQIDKKKDAAGDILKTMASQAIGVSTYKAIKSGLTSDPQLQSRYDQIKSSCNWQ